MEISIKNIQLAHEQKMTAKALLREFASYGYFPDQVVEECAALIPAAMGLNSDCVKLLCNVIKRCC